MKDLGVTIDSRLKFSQHINEITGSARRKLGLLFKCFCTRNPAILTKAYTTYVRPILEYASVIWNPVYIGQLFQIESVQRQFTKRILPDNLTYSERLRKLNLESLEMRRLKTDLIMMYKLLFGYVDIDFKEFFVINNARKTRGHAYRVRTQNSDKNCRRHFFTDRVAIMFGIVCPETLLIL